jgi:formylglycine-generating enzyme required for sulfatase activity
LEQPEGRLEPGTVFRDKLKNGSEGPEMVVIPAGAFIMGDNQGSWFAGSEKPVHQVKIPKPFAMGRYEVTFEEYDQFAKATGRELPGDQGWGRGRLPVINVSWNDAVAYAEWLSQQTAKRYRLPSEAEWEYAARAGTETRYWWGNEMKPDMAQYNKWSGGTVPVGSFTPNPFGLYDTAGNVREWVQDCWHGDYNGAPTEGSAWGPENGGDRQRVIRGGSWGDIPVALRTSYRYGGNANFRNANIGFRLAQDLN